MMGYGYGMGALGGFGWLVSLLFIVLLVVGIVYLVRAMDGGRSRWHRHDEELPARREDGAMRILRERYARGEIDREEFEQRRKDLI